MSLLLKELLGSIPVNVERLIKGHGISLNKNATPEEIRRGANRSSVAGSSIDDVVNIGEIRRSGDEYQILVLGSDHYYRKRFTMAHEFGHYILHKDKIDRLGRISDSEDYRTDGMTAEEEREANAYAAEILMPEDKVREIFLETLRNQSGNEPEAIKEMAKMFQVSKASMGLRLYLLDLITNYQTN